MSDHRLLLNGRGYASSIHHIGLLEEILENHFTLSGMAFVWFAAVSF